MIPAEENLLFMATADEIRGALIAYATDCHKAYHFWLDQVEPVRKALEAARKEWGAEPAFTFMYRRNGIEFEFGETPEGYRGMSDFMAMVRAEGAQAGRAQALAHRVPDGAQLVSGATLSRLKLVPLA